MHSLAFLKSYVGSTGTFNSYRREVEKLLQWTWYIAGKTLTDLRRQDIENFIYFIQEPPKNWIGIKKVPRFIEQNGQRIPNPQWRPFIATISKVAHKNGQKVDIADFELGNDSIKESFAILSSFFNYLLQEEYVAMNPVALVRQKNKFIRKNHSKAQVRRLSELQWQYVIKTVTAMANDNPKHERSLFILSALYSMYLRISELAANERWSPAMHHFKRDHDDNWWFTTVGKGNKERQIAVSDAMLDALKRWRKHLGYSSLPSPIDNSALLPKIKGHGPISSTTYIREIVQYCFDQAIKNLQEDSFIDEAESLAEATVHWLRHTGISDDIKHRPREHVRDDAGHSSSAITDRYIDIELKERHSSAKHKRIIDD
jgi:site-specific recombinase XerD